MAADFIEILRDIVNVKHPEIIASEAVTATNTANAATSEANAAISAGAAQVSSDVSTGSATASAGSATAAAGSATGSATSATTSAASATASVTSATASAASAAESSASATASAGSATIATAKAASILALSTLAQTLTAGSSATSSYNPTTGVITFGIPTGTQGIKGDPFTINAIGLTADRTTYDAQVAGFSFLDTQLSLIYFRVGATAGTWSTGAPFGQGDAGVDGETANLRVSGNVIQWQHPSDGAAWFDLIDLDLVYGSQFLGLTAKAADSSLLNGKSVVNSVISTDISAPAAAAAVKLAYDTGNHAHPYLGSTAKAADSALLNGKSVVNSVISTDISAPAASAAVKLAYDTGNHAHPYLGSAGKAADSSLLNGKIVLNSVTSTDITAPAAAASVKAAYDLAGSKLGATAKAVDSGALNGKTVINSVTSTDISAPAAASAVKAAYDLANSKSYVPPSQILHSTDPLRIVDRSVYLFKGDGSSDVVSIPDPSVNIAARCRFDGVLGVSQLANFGFSSITRTAVGTYAFVFSTARASAHYSVFGMGTSEGTTHRQFALVSAQTTAGFTASFNSHVSNIVGSLSVYDSTFANIIVIES